ncbi:MAG: hypothetical protein KFF77_07155, partial [Bacteroidetes bacterium]|nr:hypothetical protein [Bacteroidota bacterium]
MRSRLRFLLPLIPALFGTLLLASFPPLSACSEDDAPVAPADSTGIPDSTGQGDSVIVYAAPATLCTIADSRLTEISGITASRLRDGIFWMHNDSGDEARIFAVDTLGRTIAVCRLEGALNRDWEDMASVTIDGTSWIYVGDVGDNNSVREYVTVYRLREPALDPAWRDSALTIVTEAARFRYADGARDCEALAVDPRDGRLLLLEKDGTTCAVFAAAWPGNGGEAELTRIATFRLPFDFSFWRLVTAADLHPDGQRILLRTYNSMLEYETRVLPAVPAIFDSSVARVL